MRDNVDANNPVRGCRLSTFRPLAIVAALCLFCLRPDKILASPGMGQEWQMEAALGSVQDQRGGSLQLFYAKVKDPECSRILDLLKDSEVLDKIVNGFNESFALPVDVTLSFKECGEPNAFYDHDKKRITFCYELIGRLDDAFADGIQSDDDLEDATVGVTAFMVYHELAHALLRILNQAPSGRTEELVDQLSTFLFVQGEDEAEAAALDGATAFSDEDSGNSSDSDKLPFWGDHSLNTERYHRIICWVYGHDGQAHSDFVDDGILPGERASACKAEWARISKTWGQKLEELGRK